MAVPSPDDVPEQDDDAKSRLSDLRSAYVGLLKRSLLGITVGRVVIYQPISPDTDRLTKRLARRVSRHSGSVVAERREIDLDKNAEGTESVWTLPPWSMTMVGTSRLENVENCIRDVVNSGIPGDLIETGVWRGGTTIFMRGMLKALGVADRTVYVADSFAGVPPPDTDRYPQDAGIDLHLWEGLAVSADDVRQNFARFELLDDQVRFIEGWFRDTLPKLRGHQWAVIRLDGDLYESTMDGLRSLYPDLSAGGWLIVDDYGLIPACRQAVHDYREEHGITEPINRIDVTGVCWRKGDSGAVAPTTET